VARILNEEGYRTRKGKKFGYSTIERLLRDPTAKGLHKTYYTKSLGKGKGWTTKPESEWIYTKVEPIVSEELWDQCNSILDEQRRHHKTPARKRVHLFTGFAFCYCGNRMYVPSSNPKYTCHKCHNKISTADLEEIFHQQLKSFFFSPDEISKYLEQADNVMKDKRELLHALSDQEKKLRQDIDKVYQLYLDDKIDKEGFGQRYKPLQERLKQIEEEIPRLQAEIDFLKIQYMSSDEILSEAKDLYSRWPNLNTEEKKKIIETITEKIVVGKDDITINLCYLPPSSQEGFKLAPQPDHRRTVARDDRDRSRPALGGGDYRQSGVGL
jgi:site-specific DNA recombinase